MHGTHTHVCVCMCVWEEGSGNLDVCHVSEDGSGNLDVCHVSLCTSNHSLSALYKLVVGVDL